MKTFNPEKLYHGFNKNMQQYCFQQMLSEVFMSSKSAYRVTLKTWVMGAEILALP